MGNLLDSFGYFILAYPTWRFFILATGAVIQGELTIIFSLYLIHNGFLNWSVFVTAVLGGILFTESVLFFIAKIVRQTRLGWRWYYKIRDNRRLQIYTYFLKTNLTKLLTITKFIPATNFIIIFLAGWSKTKFKHFFKAYLLSIFIWFASILIIAYPFTLGLYYFRLTKIFREAELGIILLFIFILAIEYFFRRFLRRLSTIAEKSANFGEEVEKMLEKKQPPTEASNNENLDKK
jgi:membrane protein DedA with SNARE-associated domain